MEDDQENSNKPLPFFPYMADETEIEASVYWNGNVHIDVEAKFIKEASGELGTGWPPI